MGIGEYFLTEQNLPSASDISSGHSSSFGIVYSFLKSKWETSSQRNLAGNRSNFVYRVRFFCWLKIYKNKGYVIYKFSFFTYAQKLIISQVGCAIYQANLKRHPHSFFPGIRLFIRGENHWGPCPHFFVNHYFGFRCYLWIHLLWTTI